MAVYEFAVSSRDGNSDQVIESFSQLLAVVRSERHQLTGGKCDSDPVTMETNGDVNNTSLAEDVYLKGTHHPWA